MRFEFIGTDDGPSTIKLYGYIFTRGKATEVNEADVVRGAGTVCKVVDKLKGNPNFKEAKLAGRSSSKKGFKPTHKDNT